VMAYTGQTSESEVAIEQIRQRVQSSTRLATTAGYGPRFLHSTGQYHKGGPGVGVFLQVVQEDGCDAAIPEAQYTFSVLKQAQSLGDLEALRSRNLPVIRVNLGADHSAGWRELAASIDSALRDL
ncbi:MAG: glucose-6-phosphate isomerase, partial [Candidatus Dormibacteraceae bacterium]